MKRVLGIVLGGLALACASSQRASVEPPERAPVGFQTRLGSTSPLVGRAFDVEARREIGWDAMIDAIAEARFVLVGERHDQPDHHALQARIVSDLAERDAQPAVAFEMIDTGQAADLARARASAPGDPDAIAAAVRWESSGWPPFALYRPVFAAALAAELPIVAANVPRARASAVAHGAGDDESRALLQRAAPLPDAGRAELAARIQRGHCGHAPEAMIDTLVDAQRLRDGAMAEALLAASSREGDDPDGGPAALLIAGNGHVSRRTGVPLQLAARAPGARVASVALLEAQDGVSDPFAPGADPELELAGFDYVVFTPRLDDEDPCVKFRERLEEMRKTPPARAPAR